MTDDRDELVLAFATVCGEDIAHMAIAYVIASRIIESVFDWKCTIATRFTLLLCFVHFQFCAVFVSRETKNVLIFWKVNQ